MRHKYSTLYLLKNEKGSKVSVDTARLGCLLSMKDFVRVYKAIELSPNTKFQGYGTGLVCTVRNRLT